MDECLEVDQGHPLTQQRAPVWSDNATHNTKWIEVSWVKARGKGFYVHVRKIINNHRGGKPTEYVLAMVGKYWSPVRAAFACDLLTRFIYGIDDPAVLAAIGRQHYAEHKG